MGPAAFLQALDCRRDSLLDCIVEAEAIVRRVVKPVLLAMGVVAEVLKTRIAGDVLAQVVHAVEEIRQRIALVDVRLEHLAERSLANLAVVVLQKRRHLRWRLLLAVPVHGHGADHLRPLRRQLREIGVERHVVVDIALEMDGLDVIELVVDHQRRPEDQSEAGYELRHEGDECVTQGVAHE